MVGAGRSGGNGRSYAPVRCAITGIGSFRIAWVGLTVSPLAAELGGRFQCLDGIARYALGCQWLSLLFVCSFFSGSTSTATNSKFKASATASKPNTGAAGGGLGFGWRDIVIVCCCHNDKCAI